MGWIHVGGPLDGMDGNTDDLAAAIGLKAEWNDMDEWTITRREHGRVVVWVYVIGGDHMKLKGPVEIRNDYVE